MPRKSKKPVRKQTHSPTGKVVGQVGQILLPMIAGIAATKADLTQWVYEQGLTALHLLLREDAEEIAGLKGKHEKERTHNHWGSTNGELSFGGRRIQVSRPRVRSKSGEEASLPHFEAFRVDESILCVVDGGKGIRKALVDVLGDLAVIQRCQIHKLRNLRSYLPKSRHAYVLQTMKEAYKCKSADKARKRLQALVSWLERNGYDEAAGSLREAMEETLTVVKLALPALLRQSLATTNAIENLNGTIRRVSRNVKRWKSPSMVRRWTALGVVTAQKEFRRIKGYRHMGALVHALRSKQKSLDSDEFAA